MKREKEESRLLVAHIQKCLNDVITIDPYLSLSFPEHSEELRRMFAAMPRQGFSHDFATVPAIINKTTDDGEITVNWIMQMPQFNEQFEEVAELFFKIETFIIRPKIKKMIEDDELLRGFELGTLSEIADSLSADEEERNLIQDALVFGSNILMEIQITREPKVTEFDNRQPVDKNQPETKQEHLTVLEDKRFRYFDVYVLNGISITAKNGKKKDKVEDDQVIIIISPQYATLIEASLNIPVEDEARTGALQLSAIPLRVLELIHCSQLLNVPPSLKNGDEQDSIKLDIEELSELVPVKNSNKMNQLMAQLMRVPQNPKNN